MSQDEYFVDPQRRPALGFNELKPTPDVEQEPTEKTGWLEGFKTDIAQRSWLVNDPIAINNKLETLSELTKAGLDFEFDPVQDKYLNLVEPQYQHLLATASTEGEIYRRVAMIQREIENRKILESAPTSSIIAGGFADTLTTPWFWLPIASGLTSVKLGTEVAKSAGRAAISFGASEAISEANLQAAQLTRPMQESVANIGMATMMGGLFGGAGGLYRSAELPFYKKMVSETLGGKLVKLNLNKNFEVTGLNAYSDSAGAMRAQFIDMPGSRLLGWGKDGKLKPARPLIWALGKFGRNPVILGLSSKSPTVVWFTGKTYEHNMDVVKNAVMGKNVEQSIQTKLRAWEAKGILASVKMNRFYAEYLGLNPESALRNVGRRAFKKFPGMLNFADFQREIMIGITSGEPLTNAVMNKAAKELYAEFYEPVTKELIALNILAPDIQPEMAVQYINRVYDQAYMISNPKRTKEFLEKAYTETNEKIAKVTEQRRILEDEVEQLTTLINDSVDENATKQLTEQRKLFKSQIRDINKDLQEQVLKGEFDPDMLTGDYGMSYAQIEELRALKEPIETFDATIKNLQTELQKLGTLKNLKKFLSGELTGVESSAIADVAESIEKLGINKTLKAVKAYYSSIVQAEKQLAKQTSSLRAKIKEQNDLIKDLQMQKADKKLYIKSLEEKLAALPKGEKKQARSYKTEIANERKNLDNIPNLIKEAQATKKPLDVEISGIKDARDMVSISKESAGDAYPFIEKAVKNLSPKELESQIALIEKGIRKINRGGLKLGKIERNKIRREIKELKKKKGDYEAELELRMESKEGGLLAIDEGIYYQDKTGKFRLKDIDYGTIRLRPLLDETDIGMAAEGTYKTLTGQTEEQLLQTILDSAQLGSGGNNPLMPRSLMIADKALYQNKLLSSDFASTVRTFNLRMGRLIEMRKMLEAHGYNPKTDGSPEQWLAYKIDLEYTTFSRQLAAKQTAELEGKTGAELAKLEQKHRVENAQLAKDLERDLKIVDITYKRITGTMPRSRKELLKMARISNNYSYATQLGALALLITQDLVSPIFNHGAVHWIKGGVVPFIDMVTIASKDHKLKVKEWMSDILVGLETESALYGLAHDVRDKVEFASGWLDRNMAAAATTMGIINFSNAFGSLATKIAAHTSMSGNMRRIAKLLDGTISKSEVIALGNLGLRDERVANIIMNEFKLHGEKIRGSYVPGWEKWGSEPGLTLAQQREIAAVRETFMGAISKDIKSTIFTGSNIASYPLELDPNGLSKAFLTYMGWMFNATANYTVPLLQRYDQNRVNGLIAMWAASTTVEPLRALLAGKEPDMEPAAVFKKGLLNSGALGLPLSFFNTFNSMGKVAEGLQLDRYKYRDRGLAVSAGAPGTLAAATLNFLGMAMNNDWNKKELEQLSRTIPLSHAIEFRAILNKAIDSLDLQEKPQRGKD
jgi:hypothetical protein